MLAFVSSWIFFNYHFYLKVPCTQWLLIYIDIHA